MGCAGLCLLIGWRDYLLLQGPVLLRGNPGKRALNLNEQGCRYYERLLKQLDVGPVLVHQTYANLLDEVGRSVDALPHRELAVKLS